jgi:hypothetical protein
MGLSWLGMSWGGGTIVGDTLSLSGDATIGGTLGVTGDATFQGNVLVTGANRFITIDASSGAGIVIDGGTAADKSLTYRRVGFSTWVDKSAATSHDWVRNRRNPATGASVDNPFIIRNATGDAEFLHDLGAPRAVELNGTAHTAPDYALSGGWGTTASVAIVDAKDRRGIIDVTSLGTGQAANPTVILTFSDGAYGTAPVVVATRGDALATAGQWRVTAQTATTVTFTFFGTPVAAEVYGLHFVVVG